MAEMMDPERERERLSVVMSCLTDDLAELLSFANVLSVPSPVRNAADELLDWCRYVYEPPGEV